MITKEIFEALSDSGAVVHTQTRDQSIAMISMFNELNPTSNRWERPSLIQSEDCFRVSDHAKTMLHDSLDFYVSNGYKIVKFDGLETWYEKKLGICVAAELNVETDGEIESLIGI